jgi:hypothetical protein
MLTIVYHDKRLLSFVYLSVLGIAVSIWGYVSANVIYLSPTIALLNDGARLAIDSGIMVSFVILGYRYTR